MGQGHLKFHTERLRTSGLRPTKQRLAICKILFDRKETFHFTIEKLKKIIEKDSRKKISLATLYNTVHAFKKSGYLKEISLKGNKTFFDTNIKLLAKREDELAVITQNETAHPANRRAEISIIN